MASHRVRGPAYLALVHHGNQALITDGYENREGLSEVLEGFAQVLDLHRAYRVPLHLHLSGTLMAAIAWHQPHFYRLVRDLADQGLLEIVGSCYGQNIMPFFSAQHNLRQLNEELLLLQQHLGWSPHRVRTAWIPERVWSTPALAPVLESPTLLNGGYRYVLLDDRLLYPVGPADKDSPRTAYDRSRRWVFRTPTYEWELPNTVDEGAIFPGLQNFLPHRVAGSRGLVMLPMACDLRHLIPPERPGDLDQLVALFQALAAARPAPVAVYGDDLEKVAGVGPWGKCSLQHYEEFLAWLKTSPYVEVVLLHQWLRDRRISRTVELDPGTFYELARGWGAGEDYRGWWDDPAWVPYREDYRLAEEAIMQAQGEDGDPALLELAWQHLLASAYESGWHSYHNGAMEPAPWCRAATRHARSTNILAYAAVWCIHNTGTARALMKDLDGDGEPELVLGNDRLLAVFSPRRGGRMTFCFDLAEPRGGRLVVGNPSDDWNWQQELHRYMDQPRNHPGAFADVGAEHDRYEVQSLRSGPRAEVVMVNQEPGSRLQGTRKILRLDAGAAYVEVQYEHPRRQPVATEAALSPDYSRLLREGRASLVPYDGPGWRGWRCGTTRVWLAPARAGGAEWQQPAQPECGHGLMLRLGWSGSGCTLYLGIGEVPGALRSCTGPARVELLHEMLSPSIPPNSRPL
ncbi:MAG: hypothetical protein ACE5LU_20285 [Anaerolineae bacterium]